MKRQSYVCPECGSENVKPDSSFNTVFSVGNISDWTCNECGYSGVMPISEQEDERDEELEDVSRQQKLFYYVSRGLTLVLLLLFFLAVTVLLQ